MFTDLCFTKDVEHSLVIFIIMIMIMPSYQPTRFGKMSLKRHRCIFSCVINLPA